MSTFDYGRHEAQLRRDYQRAIESTTAYQIETVNLEARRVMNVIVKMLGVPAHLIREPKRREL